MSAIAADIPWNRSRRWDWLVPLVLGLIMAMGLFASKTKTSGGGSEIGAGCASGQNVVSVSTSNSTTNVSNAITSASNGDCVRLIASTPATWSAQVALASTKYLTLDLNGSTITLSGASGRLTVTAHATGNQRVTNGSIIKSGTSFSDFEGPVEINDTASGAAIRIDHIAFDFTGISTGAADGVLMDINGQGACLVDNNTFDGMEFTWEFIHINGWGSSDTTGWTTSVSKGGSGLCYFEDNIFTSGDPDHEESWIQGYYGARAVFRHNVFDWIRFDAHGTPGAIGQRWWELYDNDFAQSGDQFRTGCSVNIRAGSGLVFHNTNSGTDPGGDVCMGEEDSGYPATYQVGRGTNQALDVAYAWQNELDFSPDNCECQNGPPSGMVVEDRDVFVASEGTRASRSATCAVGDGHWSTDQGGNWDLSNGSSNDGTLDVCTSSNTWTNAVYTPAQYPHVERFP